MMEMQTTPKKRPPNRKEKGVLKEIAAKLPEIIVPIGVGEFVESKEHGLKIPEIEYGRIVEDGHLGNLIAAFTESRESGVAEYVKSVYDRYEKNKEQFDDTENSNGAEIFELARIDRSGKTD